jgi:hypothetical protein
MVSEFKLWNIMFPTLPISEKFIDTNNWLIQLTHLFMANDTDILKKEMNKATFSNDEISAVVFLKNLMTFDPANVFDTHKQFKNSGLDKKVILEFVKINRLDAKMIKAFFKYKPSTNGKDVMKEFGVKGPDVALKIKQIEAEKFAILAK